jgi:hypothetical protein
MSQIGLHENWAGSVMDVRMPNVVGADKSSIQFSRHTKGFCDHPATCNVERVQ